jgi:predicted Zn-dependent protease
MIMKKIIIGVLAILLSMSVATANPLKSLKKLKDIVAPSSENSEPSSQSNSGGDEGSLLDTASSLLKTETEDEEIQAGKEVVSQILGASNLVKDEAMQQYVNKVGRIVANQSERPDLPWTFGVLDTSTVNAFSAPGGYILLSKGLFDMLATEDDLAAVLGHEIAHVLRKHHFNVIKKQKLVAFGTKKISQNDKGEFAKKIKGMVGQMLARGLDKSAEYEADRDGIVLAARAGYDSSALINVLDGLKIHGEHDQTVMALMSATHPSPDDREVELAKIARDDIYEAAVPSQAAQRITSFKGK